MTNARNIIRPKVVISKLPTLMRVGHMKERKISQFYTAAFSRFAFWSEMNRNTSTFPA
jgi:hypothetical protein